MIRTFVTRILQRSDLVRILALPLLFAVFFFGVTAFSRLANRKPVIVTITPAIANPGEIIVIQGRHFGHERQDSWVEIAGDRLTANSYIQWTDTTIMATLPTTVEDGLVYVFGKNGRSNPHAFANRVNIPVAARVNADVELPVIESFDAQQTSTGRLLTIKGRNFGITRNDSEVRFSWQTPSAIPIATVQSKDSPSVACSEHDFCYEFWSDQELRVRVPDGATSGNVYVRTGRGTSNQMEIAIVNAAGTKRFSDRRTYVLSLEVDITGVSASEGSMLFVRVPVPQETASQRNVEITASDPKPYMENYRGNILHQIEDLKTGKDERITHSFLLTNHRVSTAINPALVQAYQKSPLFLMYTAPDRIVPSNKEDIVLAAAGIVGKEKNPYKKAQLIYAWITANVRYQRHDEPDRTVLESLASKSGDACDLALLFASLARAAGIPTIPVAGILVDAQRASRVHWWAEFYLDDFGWVPLDPGLACESGAAEPYFGSLGGDHIAFSRGWTDQKPMTPKSRIVYKPHSFAFQPVWEESGGNIKGYTSFWAEPKVTGVY